MHICDFTKEMSHKGGSAVVVTSAVLWVDRNLVGVSVTFAVLWVDGNSGLLCCSVLLSLICLFRIVFLFIYDSCTGHWILEWTLMISVLILWDLTQHISHISNLAIFEINFMAMYSFIGLFNAMLMLDYWYRFCFISRGQADLTSFLMARSNHSHIQLPEMDHIQPMNVPHNESLPLGTLVESIYFCTFIIIVIK